MLFKVFILKVILLVVIFYMSYSAVHVGLSNSSVGKRYVLSSSDNYDVIHARTGNNPYAFEKLAIKQIDQKHYAQAESNLLKSIALDPTNGQTASSLALLYDLEANDKSALAFKHANQLWPAYSKVRSLSANYWLKKEDYKSLLQDWNVLLTRVPEVRGHIYPVFEQLMLTIEGKNLFDSYINTPPVWWADFFLYLEKKENTSTLISDLYSLRLASEAEILEEERKVYVNLLLKNQRWSEAYFSWLGGIGDDIRYAKDYMFDGGFESELVKTGFGWNFGGNKKRYRITRERMSGMNGLKALHVSFLQNEKIDFKHVWQRIMLSPGHYKVSFRARLDNLNTIKGLSWRLRCLANNMNILGESSALKGTTHWDGKSFMVSVPGNCPVQILRLETTSSYSHEHVFKGQIWFDDFLIEKVVGEADE